MPDDKRPIEVPVETTGDKAHTTARALISAVPVVGGGLVEALNYILGPPIESRRDEWRKEVSALINELQNSAGVDVEELVRNDEFVSVLIQASQAAVKTHKQEKILRLRNVVKNTASTSVEFDMIMLFLSYLERLTEYHMKMLTLIDDNYQKVTTGEALEYDECERYIESQCLPDQLELASRIRSELEDLGFIDSETILEKGYMVLSDHGREFYDFIAS